MPNAMISLFYKDGLPELARGLSELGFRLWSTGGTGKVIADLDLPVTDISQLTGGGDMFDGRVKSLSRELAASLLARNLEHDLAELERLGLPFMDLVCVDFYPVEEAINDPASTRDMVIEKTDIGGPTMVSEGAKGRRIVICDRADRQPVLEWLKVGKPDEDAFITGLVAKADFAVSRYRALTANYHSQNKYRAGFCEVVTDLAKAENGWQERAVLCRDVGVAMPALPLTDFKHVFGARETWNSCIDLDGALLALTHMIGGWQRNFGTTPLAAVVVKHTNLCGGAVGFNPLDVAERMVSGDAQSLFGGTMVANFPITLPVVQAMQKRADELDEVALFDQIAAPDFVEEAILAVKRKDGKTKFLQNPTLALQGVSLIDVTDRERKVTGGRLFQSGYTNIFSLDDPRLKVFGPPLTPRQKQDLLLAYLVSSMSHSNTTTAVENGMVVANAVGQQSRKLSCWLLTAIAQNAKHDLSKAVAWTDSFFTAPDALEILLKAGIRAIFASEGSQRFKAEAAAKVCEEFGATFCCLPDAVIRGFKH